MLRGEEFTGRKREGGVDDEETTITTYMVQPFEMKRSVLTLGRGEPALSEHGAIKKAEALAARLPGAAALKIITDEETGDLLEIVLIASFGELPENFADHLQAAA